MAEFSLGLITKAEHSVGQAQTSLRPITILNTYEFILNENADQLSKDNIASSSIKGNVFLILQFSVEREKKLEMVISDYFAAGIESAKNLTISVFLMA